MKRQESLWIGPACFHDREVPDRIIHFTMKCDRAVCKSGGCRAGLWLAESQYLTLVNGSGFFTSQDARQILLQAGPHQTSPRRQQ